MCGWVSLRATIFDLVAVLTAWMAWNPIDPAAAATTGVPWAPRAPAWTLGDPADLSVADSTADPVTAILLLHHNPALWAVHGLALLQHHLGRGATEALALPAAVYSLRAQQG